MREVKIVTTFSKNGYQVYGKTWLESFSKNVKDNNVSVDLYLDFPLVITDKRIKIIDFDSAIPDHSAWVKSFEQLYSASSFYNKKMAIRFSFKSFVMQHAIKSNNNGYLIWLDGDCVFKQHQDFNVFPANVLAGNALAVQREHNGGEDHCESGFVVFDLEHKDIEIFNDNFVKNYQIQNVISMHQPYDGFIIYKSLQGINYSDLNEQQGQRGIQSDPSETFLHPELYARFLHNIGITGKNQYTGYSSISRIDEYFRLLGTPRKTFEEIKQARLTLVEIRSKKQRL